MKHLGLLLKKWTLVMIAFLKPLGLWGAALTALVDSSTIPVPMDFLFATFVWGDRNHAWLYVLVGAVASAVGGLLPYYLGRAGGELFLLKRINRTRYEKLRDRFERQEFLALLIPSMLPPPTPWKLFVFAAGVFEMRPLAYFTAVFLGRLVRFGVNAVLTIRYGPEVVNHSGAFFRHHLVATLTIVGVLLVALVAWIVQKSRSRD